MSRGGAEDRVAHGGVDPVGADHGIGLGRLAVGEAQPQRTAAGLQADALAT